MDLGLGNLSVLKSFLLNPALASQSVYNDAIIAIGRGVAAQIDKYCNRRIARLAGAIEEFNDDRRHFFLSRYPIETITTLEVKTSDTQGWIAQPADAILVSAYVTGFIQFGGLLADYPGRARVTYTGGYYYVILEPTDSGYPATVPTGSTALPGDIRMAWLQQCARTWEIRDKLGINVAKPADITVATQSLGALELIPQVKELLLGHKRYMVT